MCVLFKYLSQKYGQVNMYILGKKSLITAAIAMQNKRIKKNCFKAQYPKLFYCVLLIYYEYYVCF